MPRATASAAVTASTRGDESYAPVARTARAANSVAAPALAIERRQFQLQYQFHGQLQPRRAGQHPAMSNAKATIKKIGNRSAGSARRVDSRRRRAAGSIFVW